MVRLLLSFCSLTLRPRLRIPRTLAWVVIGLSFAPAMAQYAAAQDADPLKRARELNSEVLRHLNEGRFREGIPKAREVLTIREQALGPNHTDVASSLNTLGWLLLETGDYTAAKPLLDRALTIREQAFGPIHFGGRCVAEQPRASSLPIWRLRRGPVAS